MREVQVGDIFVSSWGYDQTNIDFYQVVSRTAKMVTVRKIAKEYRPGYHSLASTVHPIKDEFKGVPIKRKLVRDHEKEFFMPMTFAAAFLWDGKERTETYTH